MRMWVQYSNNPRGRSTGDCVIRALSKALGKSWEEIYAALCIQGLQMGDWGNSNPVWDVYLRQNGFSRSFLPNDCPDCYTIVDFAKEHPKGTYIVATGTHVVAVVDGSIYDTWDSSNEVPTYYYYREVE